MDELVYCEPKEVQTTKLSDVTDKQVVICKCSGQEKVTYFDEDNIPSYSGDIKSPLGIMWFYPSGDTVIVSDTDIRKWVKDACEYHKIPHILLALILQNENYPEASIFTKIGQFGERTVQTTIKIIDSKIGFSNYLENYPRVVQAIRGSSGITNISDQALYDGVKHSIEQYGRPPIPTSIRQMIFGIIDTDSRIPGDDWRNDLYYAAAHIRYLIDRELGECYSGILSDQELNKIIYSYNGSGKNAEKYAQAAMNNLILAKQGGGNLYFYEK